MRWSIIIGIARGIFEVDRAGAVDGEGGVERVFTLESILFSAVIAKHAQQPYQMITFSNLTRSI